MAPERGSFTVCVDAFEDVGACWELGLEEIERFQFPRGASTATGGQLAELRDSRAAALWRQRVPSERTLMTFLETRAMSRRFHEAEAILLADPSNQAF